MPFLEFSHLIEHVWKQVLPLYEQLHCYTKTKLAEKYGHEKVNLKRGYMPGHLLGNMWAQGKSLIDIRLVQYLRFAYSLS